MALANYNKSLDSLSQIMHNSRELVSSVAVSTKSEQSVLAKAWRAEVAYYTCLVLRMVVCVLNYEDKGHARGRATKKKDVGKTPPHKKTN